MSWFRNLFQSKDPSSALNALQEKFKAFLSLLETNHQVLKIIADMEEKTEGEYLFDINYIRTSLDEIRSGVSSIIEDMITLGERGTRSSGTGIGRSTPTRKVFFPGTIRFRRTSSPFRWTGSEGSARAA